MPEINLPPLRIPRSIESNKDQRDYFYQLQRTVYDLFNAIVSGDGTVIEDIEAEIGFDTGSGKSIDQLSAEFATIGDELRAKGPLFVQFRPVTKNTNYTALDFDYIEAEKGVRVSLPEYPDQASEVIIANGDGTAIKVLGNGRKIKVSGLTNEVVMRNAGTSLHFQYFAERGYWRIR